MKRIVLDNGQWFDRDKADRYEEDTRWNGNNHVSLATGSQWEHEELYRTKGGRWILHSWSQWQGSTPHWEEISDVTAARWLVVNGHATPAIPEVEAATAALEVQ